MPEPNKQYYYEYLRSPQWKAKRQEVFKERGQKCEKCGSTKQLQVHHLTYIRIFIERLEDLQILCRTCHRLEHGISATQKKLTLAQKVRKKKNLAKRKRRDKSKAKMYGKDVTPFNKSWKGNTKPKKW